ncbi:MAG: YhcH/YjgK/YiaL family protein [Mailhella sp.]|nr:YhcH/YjgK/YiaL family protein [Mailhella sp.]
MIVDTFNRGSAYGLGPLWEKIFPELARIAGGKLPLADGRIGLAGGPEEGGAAANIETYAPKEDADAYYESHRIMADVQVVLEGDEYVDIFPLNGDETVRQADAGRDLTFYEERPAAAVRVHLRPGLFALIMPGEAHRPCLRAGSASVRKMVVKIPAAKLLAPARS